MFIVCLYSSNYWPYTKKLFSVHLLPSSLHPWKGNGSSTAVESSYGIRTTEAWLALNKGTNCSARRRESQQPAVAHVRWPLSSRPPSHVNRKGVWTFALSRSVHHPANGAHQPHWRREPSWGGGGEVSGGGRWTPHTDSLCALGRGLHYYGVGGGCCKLQ